MKNVILSFTVEKEFTHFNPHESTNVKKSLIKRILNSELDLNLFFKNKYSKNKFKFLLYFYKESNNEIIFVIYYKNKKNLINRFNKIIKYSRKNSKRIYPIPVTIKSEENINYHLRSGNESIRTQQKSFGIIPWMDIEKKLEFQSNESISLIQCEQFPIKSVEDAITIIDNGKTLTKMSFINYINTYQVRKYIGDVNIFNNSLNHPQIKIGSNFRGTKEQKELLLRIKERKSGYASLNKQNYVREGI